MDVNMDVDMDVDADPFTVTGGKSLAYASSDKTHPTLEQLEQLNSEMQATAQFDRWLERIDLNDNSNDAEQWRHVCAEVLVALTAESARVHL
jgi:hypothetical protein